MFNVLYFLENAFVRCSLCLYIWLGVWELCLRQTPTRALRPPYSAEGQSTQTICATAHPILRTLATLLRASVDHKQGVFLLPLIVNNDFH